MISYMGNKDEKGKGGFLLLDENFEPKGLWSKETTALGYDFWYQPRFNIMVSSEFGSPSCFKNGFNPAEVPENYGRYLHFWNWSEKTLLKSVDLGVESGLIPLEVRFLHDPSKAHGFVGVALSSTIVHIYRNNSGDWVHEPVIKIPNKKVSGWVLPEIPSLVTDILISLDDKFFTFLIGFMEIYDNTIFLTHTHRNLLGKFLSEDYFVPTQIMGLN